MPRSLFPNAAPDVRAALELDPTIKLLNDYDWSQNPLGIIPDWTESLKGAVRVMMVASTPMVMLVGEDGILIYNNAYAQFAGQRHPQIFGMPALIAWPEIADFNRDNIKRGLNGESWILQDQELVLNRHGRPEASWMDLHYSPLVGEDGLPMGTLCIVHETTDRVLTEKALARSEERLSLALASSALVGTWDWDLISNIVTSDDQFAAMYNVDVQSAGLGVPIEQYLLAIDHEDLPRVHAELQKAIEAGEEFRSEYRVVDSSGERRWLMVSGRPRRNAEGRVHRFPGVAIDITDQRRAAQALAKSELEFRTLADTMPQMIWATRPDGFHDYYNARWYEFTGMEPGSTDGAGWNGVFHPDDQERAWGVWRHSLETGEPYQIEYRLRHHSGEYRWTLGRALPIRDASGEVLRWIGTCTDIHDTRKAAEERELVAQELSHRIKNIFAVLTGIISLSARGRPEMREFADQLRQRIYALGEAHDFVRPHSHLSDHPDGQGTLSQLLARLMRPYEDASDATRVRYSGDDTIIDDASATPLALLFHELATNAAKYGALHAEEGWVEVTGRRDGDSLHLIWKEHGGPATAAPETPSGFGSKLIELSVAGQMRGQIERLWESDGLRVDLALPMASLLRSSRLQASETSAP
ncbi:PAS domain S-box-containing protein [Devosia crocina]|uniref:Blue-light-activated histidine kinase n=1 Tax=Devosia crocina TaxID=429728 RepID=A0A1I7NM54_9HYPH|nr:PAS domain S-box protein [Devosia crocina]SFV35727.1 PAS domain S-box-containing protein [Devosia crocina]